MSFIKFSLPVHKAGQCSRRKKLAAHGAGSFSTVVTRNATDRFMANYSNVMIQAHKGNTARRRGWRGVVFLLRIFPRTLQKWFCQRWSRSDEIILLFIVYLGRAPAFRSFSSGYYSKFALFENTWCLNTTCYFNYSVKRGTRREANISFCCFNMKLILYLRRVLLIAEY